jgi:tetratricopeptide (TPR) repeat protein
LKLKISDYYNRLKKAEMMKKTVVLALACASFFSVKAQTIEEAVKALEVEQYEKSRVELVKLAQSMPTDYRPYFYLGELYFRIGDNDSSAYFYRKGIEANQELPYNSIGLAKVALAQGDTSAANSLIDKANAYKKGKDALTNFYIGEAYLRAGQKALLPKAKLYFDRALALDKKNADIYISLGDYYTEMTDGTNATSNYKKALEINPNNPKVYVAQGQIYKRALNFEVSLENFNKALEIDPSYPPAYRELGELYYKAGKYSEAIENYKKFIQLTDNYLNTQVRYASFLFLNKKYDETLNVIRNILKLDTNKALVYRLKGYSNFELGNYPLAIQDMKAFFAKVNSKKILASDYAYLGKAYIKDKQDSLGVLTIQQALEIDTANVDLISELAEAMFSTKDFVGSAKMYNKKKDMKGLTATEYFYWGRALYFSSNFTEADTVFGKLIEVQPKFSTSYLYRARSNAAMEDSLGKRGLAKPWYEKVLELEGGNPDKYKRNIVEAYEYLGNYYFQGSEDKTNPDAGSDKQMALETYTKLKALEPENAKANAYLTQVKAK